MRTLILSIVVVTALVIGSVWFVAPTVQADSETTDLELYSCALPGIVQCGLMTRLACQNAGGKIVEKCEDPVRIK
jgi:hypothetical protein